MQRTFWQRIAPGLVLMLLAPLMAELLPGATRFSSIFVFPVEMAVWGGGAVMIRALVRRRGLGWWNLVLLGLALALAEECLIQQTSLAPLVVQIKHQVWARAFGINYVYLIWALVYEAVWVTLLPVLLAEMLFPDRREEAWLSRAGATIVGLLFVLGCLLAWFSWTHIARVQIFHLPPYTPPLPAVIMSLACVLALIWAGLRLRPAAPRPSAPPAPWLAGLAGAVWAILWYGLCLLAFGIQPSVPPIAAIGGALAVTAAVIALLPGWTASPVWRPAHDYALVLGALTGSMAASFVGFIGSPAPDVWFKIVSDALAFLLLLLFGRRIVDRRAETHKRLSEVF
ncbi:MAG TPA: hypothetical protein VFW19_12980 [Allosphingosinicella sp.]|nr:hypothetical protein [Allosphingosinicella sp.]